MFIRLTIMALILLAEMIGGGTAYGWYNSGWLYRQQITIQSNKVSGALTNFPVLLTESNVQAAIWQHAQSNGLDLVLIQQDDKTRLAHEVEKFDAAVQQMAVWVKLPVLSAETNLTFYIYYGSAVTNGLQNRTNVWDSNYCTVLHLQETNGTHFDSTTNLLHAIPMPYGAWETGDVAITTCETTNGWSCSPDCSLTTTNDCKEGTASVQYQIPSIDYTKVYTNTYRPETPLNIGSRVPAFWWKLVFSGWNVYIHSYYHYLQIAMYDTSGYYLVRDLSPSGNYSADWYSHFPGDYSGIASNGPVDLQHINRIDLTFRFQSAANGSNFVFRIDNLRAVGVLDQNASGKIGGADRFNGDKNSLRLTNSISYSNVSVSAWFKTDTTSYGGIIFSDPYLQNAYSYYLGLSIGPNNNVGSMSGNYVRFHLQTVQYMLGSQVDTNWHYLVGTRDNTGSILYLDGVQAGTSNFTASARSGQFNIGSIFGGLLIDVASPFKGLIDEVRLSGVARSADWVATEYNNQSDPATFAGSALEKPFPSGTIFRIH